MPEKAFIAAGCGSACGVDETNEARTRNAAARNSSATSGAERRCVSSRTRGALSQRMCPSPQPSALADGSAEASAEDSAEISAASADSSAGLASPTCSDDDEGDEAADDAAAAALDRSTSFVLNGSTYTFENPVSLVLAAARQLGMAIKRDAALLWIADEALVDEYDGSLDVSDSAAPLGEDCLGYYADIFAERSKPTLLAAPAGGGAAPSGRLGRKGSRGSNKLTRKQWSRALREERLSHVSERSERSTGPVEPLDFSSFDGGGASGSSDDSGRSPSGALSPVANPLGSPLPRIDGSFTDLAGLAELLPNVAADLPADPPAAARAEGT